MRIALFFLVNIAVAIGVVALSFAQGQSVGTIVLRVVGVLVALQLVYVLWLVIVARLRPSKAQDEEKKTAAVPDKSLEDA